MLLLMGIAGGVALAIVVVMASTFFVVRAVTRDPGGAIVERYSPEWLDRMYLKYHDKMACVDGRYYDIGKYVSYEGKVSAMGSYVPFAFNPAEKVGECRCLTPGWQVVDCAGVLIQDTSGESGRIIAIRNYTGGGLTKGGRFPYQGRLIYRGNASFRLGYRYVEVECYDIYKPLTKKQFCEALASGFRLVEYKFVHRQKTEAEIAAFRKQWGTGFFGEYTEDTVIETPEDMTAGVARAKPK